MCIALIAGSLAGCILGVRQLRAAAAGHRGGRWESLALARRSAGFLWSGLGSQLQNIDVTLVGVLAGSAAAGILAAPSRLTTPIGVAAAAAASVVLAQNRYLVQDHANRRHAVTKITASVFAVTAIGTLPLWAFPRTTARILLGTQYEPAANVLRVVALGTCIAAINQPLAAHLQAKARQRYVGLSVLLGGVAGLATVAALARPVGAMGGGIGILGTQAVVLRCSMLELCRFVAVELTSGTPSVAYRAKC